jgi:curli production assembly/transport component CsgE
MEMSHKLRRAFIWFAWTSLTCTATAHGAELKGPDLNGRVLNELYGGIVVDQTITVIGHEFYQYFVALWRDQDLSNRYAISIHERPTARWGSQIWIEYAQRRVFQTVLPPTRTNIKSMSEQAVEVAYPRVIDVEVQRLLFRDPDLGADEI